MPRYIDANNLNFEGQNYNKSQMKAILDFVDAQPTAYEPETVEQQLFQNSYTDTVDGECIRAIRLDVASEIVRNAGKDGAE